jgi:hypothetical protein
LQGQWLCCDEAQAQGVTWRKHAAHTVAHFEETLVTIAGAPAASNATATAAAAAAATKCKSHATNRSATAAAK